MYVHLNQSFRTLNAEKNEDKNTEKHLGNTLKPGNSTICYHASTDKKYDAGDEATQETKPGVTIKVI